MSPTVASLRSQCRRELQPPVSVLFLILLAVISVVDEVESGDIRIAAVEIPVAHLGSYTLLRKTCCRQVSTAGSHQQALGLCLP